MKDSKTISKLYEAIHKVDYFSVDEKDFDENKFFSTSSKQKASLVSTGNYKLSTPIQVNTDVLGLGVHTVDLFTGTSNKNGIYQIKMYENNELCYQF